MSTNTSSPFAKRTLSDDTVKENLNPLKISKSAEAEIDHEDAVAYAEPAERANAANMVEHAEVPPTADTAAEVEHEHAIDHAACVEVAAEETTDSLDPRTTPQQALDDVMDEAHKARKDLPSSKLLRDVLETAAATAIDSFETKEEQEEEQEDKDEAPSQTNKEAHGEAPETADSSKPVDEPLDKKEGVVPVQEKTGEVVVAVARVAQPLYGATEAQLVATGITEAQARRVHMCLQRNEEQTSWSDVRAATLSAKAVKALQAAGYVLHDAGTYMLL